MRQSRTKVAQVRRGKAK